MLSTTNADITGYISTSTHLDLSTSNADIKVDVDMYNDDKGKSTSVNMKTSNGYATQSISQAERSDLNALHRCLSQGSYLEHQPILHGLFSDWWFLHREHEYIKQAYQYHISVCPFGPHT